MAEAASFANLWVPFCRKHDIEPRNPGSYFSLKRDIHTRIRCDQIVLKIKGGSNVSMISSRFGLKAFLVPFGVALMPIMLER
ncbi:hypothetical protein U1Q18_019074 [Sarracenia purpurea var. burkii]